MVEDCNDGVWFGVRYYDCKPNRGMFVHLSELKPARRMMKITEGTYIIFSLEYTLITFTCVLVLFIVKCISFQVMSHTM